jgi:hypothetical protein
VTPNIAPPPGLSPGIPLPPFARQQAAPKEPKQSAAQQTIKIEESEAIHEERKKSRTRAYIAAGIGALVGAGIGFVAGGSNETGQRAKAAARNAATMEKDVKELSSKLEELDAKIDDAQDKISKKTFPETLATELGGYAVTFEKGTLVTGLPTNTIRHVLDFTKSVETVNKAREDLQKIIGLVKDPIVTAWKEEGAPVAHFAVQLRSDGKNIVGDLLPLSVTFPWKGAEFPDKLKISAKPADKEIKRFPGGKTDITSDTFALPIDPKTTGFASDTSIFKLRTMLIDLSVKLKGNPADPNAPDGIVKTSKDLVLELHKASLNQ